MRSLLVLMLLVGCTATDWRKQGATRADLDRDYDDCRNLTKPDPAIAALYGAFGAVGVFFGTNANDSRIRACLQAKGWSGPAIDDVNAATAGAAVSSGTAPGSVDAGGGPPVSPAPQLVKTVAPESPAAKRLVELKSLRDQGLISEREYEEKRQAILRGL